MNRQLYILHDIPFPDNDGGKKLSLGRILENASDTEKIVLAFNYRNINVQPAKEFFLKKNIKFEVFQEKYENKGINKLLRYIWYFFSYYPAYYQRLKNKKFSMKIYEIVNIYKPSKISVETLFLCSHLPMLLVKDNTEVELVFHNVESVFFKALSFGSKSIIDKAKYFFESIKITFLEKKIANCINNVSNLYAVCLSKEDSLYYQNKYRFHKAKMRINNNEIFIDQKVERNPNILNPFFLFPGSVDFPPNREGIIWLLEKYDLDSEINIPIIITGACSIQNMKMFKKYDKLKFTGYLSRNELMKMYKECICVVSPIISGGGIKIKNIETINLGVPIIMTEFSAIGIIKQNYDSEKIIITKNDAFDFCSALSQIGYRYTRSKK